MKRVIHEVRKVQFLAWKVVSPEAKIFTFVRIELAKVIMRMLLFAFGVTDWSTVEQTGHKGETGVAYWRTRYFGDGDGRIRVRMVEYSPGYLADHWCSKGHILLCLEGELETTLKDGRKFVLQPGMSYQVSDEAEAHQSYTRDGAKLFIVD